MPDRTEPAFPLASPAAPWSRAKVQPASVETTLRRADQARDAGRCAEAAVLYSAALAAGCADPAIRVQLGNMLKEGGEWLRAEAAYRAALAEDPGSADAWLQLGHVLKLLGRTEAAVEAYQASVARDPLSGHAAAELIGLGAGWRIGEASYAGRSLLYDTLAAVHDLRRTLAMLEARLPALESLAAVPADRFDLYRARYRPWPPSGAAGAPLDLLVLPDATAMGEAVASLAALRHPLAAAAGRLGRIVVLAPTPALQDVAERHLRPVAPGLAARLPQGAAPEGWVLVLAGAATPCETAVAWFAHAAALAGPEVSAVIADEVLAPAGGGAATPLLLPGPDPLALAAAGHTPCLLAVRHRVLAAAGPDPAALLAAAMATGRILHIPRLLAERRRAAPPRPALRIAAPPLPIRVIIATRDAGPLLERCVQAAGALAAHPGLLRWTIIDNRPPDAADRPDAVLRRLAAEPGVGVLRRPESFNWSAFNNAAAAGATEPLLLFLNDDVELLTEGWDRALAEAFADPAVAAAGARLLYPDGRVQHAGIVLGVNGRTEHEGQGADRGAEGPARRWVTRRRAGAVTGAFLACRTAAFHAQGGFDATDLPIWFNDIDLCLKLRAARQEVLFLGDVEAVHHESRTLRTSLSAALRDAAWGDALATMHARWGGALTRDPTFNPHFSRAGRPFEMLCEPSEAEILAWLQAQA